jgi:hypothetical protein
MEEDRIRAMLVFAGQATLEGTAQTTLRIGQQERTHPNRQNVHHGLELPMLLTGGYIMRTVLAPLPNKSILLGGGYI